MKFGRIPVDQAEGAILAHSVAAEGLRLRKSHRIAGEDVAALQQAGIAEVMAARLEPGDLGEDEAAARLAAAFRTEGVEARDAATGRVNLHAARPGLFTVDRALVDAVNGVDPAITLATLAPFTPVEAGRMVATVKIIPFAVAGRLVDQAIALCRDRPIFRVEGWRPASVALIQTVLGQTKSSLLDKTARITAARLSQSGSSITTELRPAHETGLLAAAIRQAAAAHDLLIVFGASAMSDPDDVVPAAIRAAGGSLERAGMPVDPGNLIALGRVAGKPVVGAPGCARSPKENGFDWVLDRILAGLDITARDIAAMGVGGLLMEIESRPQPRESAAARPSVEVQAVVLAAGRSSRMGGPNKLLARFGATPLVRRTAERALASRAAGVTVVTGHQAERVRAALEGIRANIVHNPDFSAGFASSLKAGLAALPDEAGGAMIVLGDMPQVTTDDLDRLIEAFRKGGGHAAVRATHGGRRGNPVILPRALFAAVGALEGDTGARHLLEGGEVEVIDVEIGEGASLDVDTPDRMARAGGVLQG